MLCMGLRAVRSGRIWSRISTLSLRLPSVESLGAGGQHPVNTDQAAAENRAG